MSYLFGFFLFICAVSMGSQANPINGTSSTTTSTPLPEVCTLNEEFVEAVEKGDLDRVKQLVKLGQDVNAKDEYGLTALHIASTYDKLNIVEFLVERGAIINAKYDFGGETALYFTLISTILKNRENRTGELEVLKYLIEHGADVNARTRNASILQVASTFGSLDLVKYLVEHGAQVNASDGFGSIALHVATSFDRMEIVKYFLEIGVEVNSIDENGRSALDIALSENSSGRPEKNVDIAKMLKDAGGKAFTKLDEYNKLFPN